MCFVSRPEARYASRKAYLGASVELSHSLKVGAAVETRRSQLRLGWSVLCRVWENARQIGLLWSGSGATFGRASTISSHSLTSCSGVLSSDEVHRTSLCSSFLHAL